MHTVTQRHAKREILYKHTQRDTQIHTQMNIETFTHIDIYSYNDIHIETNIYTDIYFQTYTAHTHILQTQNNNTAA